MQLDIMTARDDLQRVELQILHRGHGLLGAQDSLPASAGPKSLLAEDEATSCVDIDRQQRCKKWLQVVITIPQLAVLCEVIFVEMANGMGVHVESCPSLASAKAQD